MAVSPESVLVTLMLRRLRLRHFDIGRIPATTASTSVQHAVRLSSIAGTAQCYDSHYFVISNGNAEEQPAPPGFEDGEGAACGVGREFGRIDGANVYLVVTGEGFCTPFFAYFQ
jgi:hypothetical protein